MISNTGSQWKMKLHKGPNQQNFVIMIFPTVNQRLTPFGPNTRVRKFRKCHQIGLGFATEIQHFELG